MGCSLPAVFLWRQVRQMNPNGKSLGWKLALTSCLTIGEVGAMITSLGNCAFAQITPDNTLPNNSRVTKQDNTNLIEGGTQAGSNLFHSFEEFSVPTGEAAYFNNAVDIQNIISRVTGKSISNIDGLIRANGTANLFLINPNGIIFGQNARLDIGGSFVGTTADAIGFGDQGFFSADNPENSSSLLSVNPSALLFNQIKTASIQNNSIAPSGLNPSSAFTARGLRVPDGKSLLLVGGDINMDGGGLYAFGGRIELGSVAGSGLVRLNSAENGYVLSYENVQDFRDILLSKQAAVNASGEGGGDIQVQGKYVRVADGSLIQTQTFGSKSGGNLTVTASEAVELIGTPALGKGESRSRLTTETKGVGKAGDITITTKRLIVQNGALISTGASLDNGIRIPRKEGAGGNLTIRASESIELTGETGIENNLQSRLTTQTAGNETAIAGDLTINTGKLVLKDGAQISAGTFPRSEGDGGNLTITADSIEVIGVSKYSRQVSRITNLTAGAGNAKELNIKTGKLIVREGGLVSAGTVSRNDNNPENLSTGSGGNLNISATDLVEVNGFSDTLRSRSRLTTRTEGAGKAGDLIITTSKLIIENGAQVSAGTLSKGEGGDLTVIADLVKVSGESADGKGVYSRLTNRTESEGNAGNSKIRIRKLIVQDGGQVSADTLRFGRGGNLDIYASDSVEVSGRASDSFPSSVSAKTNGVGSAGNLIITTLTLTVKDGAQVSVRGDSGDAGDLVVNSRDLILNQGLLQATTASSGQGGNINLTVEDILLLRNNSQISTTGGIAEGSGNGGNINIEAKDGFIVAGARENNDISANAFAGQGGQVNINAAGILGIAPRSREDLINLLGTDEPNELDAKKLSTNDITAISQQNPNLSGTIEIVTSNTDPNSGLIELPTIPVDTEVAQGCYSPNVAQSRFVITGRGGLPPNPKDILTPDAALLNWVSLQPNNNNSLAPVTSKPTTSTPKRIVEATGATLNAKGQIVLTANSSTVTPHTSRQNPIQCHGR
jgi:filamentous hemagglutinin family protein